MTLGQMFIIIKKHCGSTYDRVEVAYWWRIAHGPPPNRGLKLAYYRMRRNGFVTSQRKAYNALCDAAGCPHMRGIYR